MTMFHQPREAAEMKISTIGIDLATNTFQVHGVDERGKRVLTKSLKRHQLAEFFANLPECVIGMESCGSAHHWARKLQQFGHTVKLMAPQFVKTYVKTNKNDPANARGAVQAATLLGLRRAIRRGSVWVAHSDAYCDPDRVLIAEDKWPAERRRHLTRLQLPAKASEFLETQMAALDAGLAAVAEAVREGRLRIEDNCLRLSPLRAEPGIGGLRRFRQELCEAIGPVQLPDVLLEIDARVRYSSMLLGRTARSKGELLASAEVKGG
jgi:hypothetical protein